jgi:hypothetical protein
LHALIRHILNLLLYTQQSFYLILTVFRKLPLQFPYRAAVARPARPRIILLSHSYFECSQNLRIHIILYRKPMNICSRYFDICNFLKCNVFDFGNGRGKKEKCGIRREIRREIRNLMNSYSGLLFST